MDDGGGANDTGVDDVGDSEQRLVDEYEQPRPGVCRVASICQSPTLSEPEIYSNFGGSRVPSRHLRHSHSASIWSEKVHIHYLRNV